MLYVILSAKDFFNKVRDGTFQGQLGVQGYILYIKCLRIRGIIILAKYYPGRFFSVRKKIIIKLYKGLQNLSMINRTKLNMTTDIFVGLVYLDINCNWIYYI